MNMQQTHSHTHTLVAGYEYIHTCICIHNSFSMILLIMVALAGHPPPPLLSSFLCANLPALHNFARQEMFASLPPSLLLLLLPSLPCPSINQCQLVFTCATKWLVHDAEFTLLSIHPYTLSLSPPLSLSPSSFFLSVCLPLFLFPTTLYPFLSVDVCQMSICAA